MDIVERLKCSLFGSVEREAAYEIERLREQAHYHYENGLKKDVEIERLLEALRGIIPYIDTCNAEHREAQDKARSALQQKESE